MMLSLIFRCMDIGFGANFRLEGLFKSQQVAKVEAGVADVRQVAMDAAPYRSAVE